MAERKDREQDIWARERQRRSSFVVDLRPAAKLKEEAREAVQAVRQEAAKISAVAATVLTKAEKGMKREMRREQKKISRNFSTAVTKTEKRLARSRPFKLWRAPSRWQRLVAAQERIFRSSAKISQARRGGARQRAERAGDRVLWYRSLISFAIILLVIILPLKLLSYSSLFNLKDLENKILNHSNLALNDLKAATAAISSLDFKKADSRFQEAGANFLAAQNDLDNINDAVLSLAALSHDPKLKLASESKKFLTAGALAASLGRQLVLATDSLFNGDKNNFSATLDNFIGYGRAAVSDAKDLKAVLAQINPANLPADYQAQFASLNTQTGLLADNLDNFVSAAAKLKEVLGFSRDKRYLLVFQNNTELRASGGFLGSYALMDLRGGKIRNLEVPGGGSYDTEAGLKVLVTAPQPLWLVNPLWHFWDANWWPDWPTTAENLMWFYYKSGGPSVDGVISVTPTVVEGLLKITGPIVLPEYGLTISADNFWDTVQKIVEANNLVKINPALVAGLPTSTAPIISGIPLEQGLETNSANKPKKIIGDLMVKILEILPQKLDQENLLKILSLLQENLAQKQILFYFNDAALEREVLSRNWGGAISATERDYLLVVDTNIAGQKSDAKMVEKIDLSSQVDASGAIINTVKISRAHTGIKNEPMTGVRNVDWLRVYVPEGSVLLSSSGWRAPAPEYLQQRPDASWQRNPLLINEEAAATDPESNTKIYTENDKTVFANWLMVDPGETGVITLTYRLPFNFFMKPDKPDGWLARINALLNPETKTLYPYSLLVQKQPGAKVGDFSARLSLPTAYNIFWRYPDDLIGASGWEITAALDGDKYWSILAQPE